MKKIFILSVLLLTATLSWSQDDKLIQNNMSALIQDGANNFVKYKGEVLLDDKEKGNVYYKSLLPMEGISEAIIVESKFNRTSFISLNQQKEGENLNINALQNLIKKMTAMQELGKSLGLKYERVSRTEPEGGFVTTLKDKNDKVVVILINYSGFNSLTVNGK